MARTYARTHSQLQLETRKAAETKGAAESPTEMDHLHTRAHIKFGAVEFSQINLLLVMKSNEALLTERNAQRHQEF